MSNDVVYCIPTMDKLLAVDKPVIEHVRDQVTEVQQAHTPTCDTKINQVNNFQRQTTLIFQSFMTKNDDTIEFQSI